MKCPKCNYISFDSNLICPKCNKDISIEREKINLPSFKPNPPFLLGSLVRVSHGTAEIFIKEENNISQASQQNPDVIEFEGPITAGISQKEFDDAYRLDTSRKSTSVEVVEESAPSLFEGAQALHRDAVALENEFSGLDLELEESEEKPG